MKLTRTSIKGETNDSVFRMATIFVVIVAALLPARVFAASAYIKSVAPGLIEKADVAYGGLVDVAALLYNVDPELILAVIIVESEGNPKALSRRGAEGLMQLMPNTAKAMGATNPKEPLQNIFAGTKYLKELEESYGFIDSKEDALVAYNMGPARAKKWLARSDPKEYPYVVNVMYVYALLEERKRVNVQSIQGGLNKLAMEFTDVIVPTAQPMLSRPRSLSLRAFPMSIPSGRRLEAKQQD
ncbi:MAG: hypothetical protein A3D65_06635 [Candidatus Lloydbacteria bacterium RIFCSPHIGHO2_02_FULL_50_13]|uniref:Transglycosylase SLT domain-containing protein n=1 Tax=Candidatus Lloydbacteria bacterium RIFCSPHIGHO2_02_FULL_50_13 TaxID=1798661 RepID=A0A1G2D066_9BACT|nr:MAG: hypothetical protein A3D65_06620 [Candidatus Lloydbacteria bacterium RIFCSPHIGHO2_02_FULL_50_13]OGZ07016.1 MAG: hypothetical protein A3D65_06635 [Candidatus Lloydbacteria bacterium RIFCSPHIGHO2_02_FULL_50_13]